MKYLVKTRTVEIWNHWYEVEADSADEANDIITEGGNYMKVRDHGENFLYTDDEEVEEIEPLNNDVH